MELEYGDKKWIQIDVQNTCRIVIPVQRYCLNSTLNFGSKSSKEENIKLEHICQKHLHDFINLKWTLPAVEISGIASFSQIDNWTASKLDALIVSPLQWAVFINNDPPGMEDFSFVIGELILISVDLQNISDFTLKSLHLCIQGYQDYQNGFHNYHLDTKLAVIGSDKILINEIFPQNTHHHQCGLMFFNTGTYFLDIKCSSSDYRTKYNTLSDSQIKTAQITSESHNKSIYTWKFTPTIELTILED
ncbi:protein brunelleschi-like [Centruroides sculpturatus]|uniref:protein brunelleschi-like n=1 Tax=Centruroides sculpturatus TaxID=218467 RepID=UPI000C6CC4CD|nr:protein brunelleschi-like [Centruroides sculpturatus]